MIDSAEMEEYEVSCFDYLVFRTQLMSFGDEVQEYQIRCWLGDHDCLCAHQWLQ